MRAGPDSRWTDIGRESICLIQRQFNNDLLFDPRRVRFNVDLFEAYLMREKTNTSRSEVELIISLLASSLLASNRLLYSSSYFLLLAM